MVHNPWAQVWFKLQPWAGFTSGLPSPQSMVRLPAGAAALWSMKLKFQDPEGSQMLKVVRLLKEVICSGPAEVSAAGGAGVTFTVIWSVLQITPSSSVAVTV